MWEQERDKMLDNERLAAHSRMAEVAEKFVNFISSVCLSHSSQNIKILLLYTYPQSLVNDCTEKKLVH